MDDNPAFLEMSALLTGLPTMVKDKEDKILNGPISDEYLRRLKAVFPGQIRKLLDAYIALASASPKPEIDDALLATFRATPEFQDKANEFVARQVVNIWYFSQFKEKKESSVFLDGGFYERGAAWPLIKAHPIGFSHRPTGYWSAKP